MDIILTAVTAGHVRLVSESNYDEPTELYVTHPRNAKAVQQALKRAGIKFGYEKQHDGYEFSFRDGRTCKKAKQVMYDVIDTDYDPGWED